MFLASEFAEEYSFDYGESITTALDANMAQSDEFNKQQMLVEFEKELAQIYSELREAETQEAQQRKAEHMYYQDILDGIIVI